jgi:hypothetical protein
MRIVGMVMIALTMTACGPKIREARFRPAPPRTPPEQVAVYQASRPGCQFEELGTVTVEKRNAFVSSQEMLNAMRQRAARMGGDALLGLAEGSVVGALVPVGDLVAVANRQTFSATVIRFLSLDCRRE